MVLGKFIKVITTYYVYVFRGKMYGKLYVGRTATLLRRVEEHMRGRVFTTKKWGELELLFFEAFKAKTDAIGRERYLKTSKDKSTLRQMLRDTLQNHE